MWIFTHYTPRSLIQQTAFHFGFWLILQGPKLSVFRECIVLPNHSRDLNKSHWWRLEMPTKKTCYTQVSHSSLFGGSKKLILRDFSFFHIFLISFLNAPWSRAYVAIIYHKFIAKLEANLPSGIEFFSPKLGCIHFLQRNRRVFSPDEHRPNPKKERRIIFQPLICSSSKPWFFHLPNLDFRGRGTLAVHFREGKNPNQTL